MREMKDSGIPWIGKIPHEWKCGKVGYYSNITKLAGFEFTDYFDYEADGDVIAVRGINLKNFKVDLSNIQTITKAVSDMLPRSQVKHHDILVSYAGSVGNIGLIEDDRYRYHLAPNVGKITLSGDAILANYLAYYFVSYAAQEEIYQLKNKNAQESISMENLRRVRILVPEKQIQQAIVAFLDSKCAEIDALCANIESEIETLEAYKRSVITEAVTKGLDKNVPMKDSGTIWLGRIPESWGVSRIAAIYRLRTTKVSDEDFEPLSVTMKGIVPQLDSAAKTNAHDDRKLVRKGDFVINSRSDRRGSCGIAKQDGSVSLINTVLAPLDDMNPEYYDWLFHTVEFADEFYKWGHGIVDDLWTTGWQDMKRIIIPSPSVVEQEAIANYLNDKCHRIDSIITQKQEQLTVLADYKKSVIYEYVTGKKEVPA